MVRPQCEHGNVTPPPDAPAAGAAIGGVAPGMSSTTPHDGHFPFFPAIDDAARMTFEHWGQENDVTPLLVEAGGLAPCERPAELGAVDAPPVSGICTIALHVGHFPFLPAAESGVRTCPWHWGH